MVTAKDYINVDLLQLSHTEKTVIFSSVVVFSL